MRYLTSVFSLIAFVALSMAAVTPMPSETVTVQGHLIDTKCYGMGVNMGKAKMNYGNAHMVKGKDGTMQKIPNCATACANMGIPVGIVEGSEPGNKTYVLVTPAGQLADHMNKEARVTGQLVYDGGLIPGKIEVKEDDGWQEVKIATMM
jgi:hypothetical protein